jgi:hypothetical protein
VRSPNQPNKTLETLEMKLNRLAKSLTLATSAFGMMVLVPFANIAMAQTSGPATDVIDLSIDVNQDGVSDQLFEELKKIQVLNDESFRLYQEVANEDGTFDDGGQEAIEASNAILTEAAMQLEARLPWSDNARQMIALGSELAEQYMQFDAGWGEGSPEQTALEAKMVQEGNLRDQEPSIVAVNEAYTKVYEALGY